jgi:hypothetical protein
MALITPLITRVEQHDSWLGVGWGGGGTQSIAMVCCPLAADGYCAAWGVHSALLGTQPLFLMQRAT